MGGAYDNERLAAGYAFDRPPVHEQILRSVPLAGRRSRGLDVGCGAGRSTAALCSLTETVIGLEPVAQMLAHCGVVAPAAHFVVGAAERLPFAAGAFDLMTAAGSLNYVDLGMFLPEVARVLTAEGMLVIYDFSEGRRAAGDDRLTTWFKSFEERFPWPPGYEDFLVHEVAFDQFGLHLDSFEQLEISVPMALETYVRYVLSDVNVGSAMANGMPEIEIRDWCLETLTEIFGAGNVDVVFEGYVACVRPAAPKTRRIADGLKARPLP